MNFDEKVQIFVKEFQKQQIKRLEEIRLDCEANIAKTKVHIVPGRKYLKIYTGNNYPIDGKFMIDIKTEEIYVMRYGKIDKQCYCGTLDTMDDYDWKYSIPIKKDKLKQIFKN
jgi:RNA-splicing ligase RtcB